MGHKILLADDSITIQKVIELTFSDEDFELHTVGNGQKAIDEIRSIQPDIVLCDIIMPEKNGYEVCEFIKSTDELQHIPVLLLTGAFEPFDQERAKAAGCEGFLAKPFEPQTLISKVKELLASPGNGAVLIVDGGGSLRRSLVGGNVAASAEANDWAGIIVYGAVRDRLELEATKIGLKALALIPVKTEKRDIGDVDVNLEIEQVLIRSGAYVYADEDGVLITPRALHG